MSYNAALRASLVCSEAAKYFRKASYPNWTPLGSIVKDIKFKYNLRINSKKW